MKSRWSNSSRLIHVRMLTQEEFSSLVDSYIVKYHHQAITGTLHSDYHYPAHNYLYQSNISIRDSAFYANCIDQELVASKGLSEEHILAANIEAFATYDPNTFPHYATDYKLKTIIEVLEPVCQDRHLELCQNILTVFGLSKYDPTKKAIVTQYLAVVNQFTKHMTAPHPCSVRLRRR